EAPRFPWRYRAVRHWSSHISRHRYRRWLPGTDYRSLPRRKTRARSGERTGAGSGDIAEKQNRRAFEHKSNEHGVLAPDLNRCPTEERTRQAVQDAVHGQRKRQCRERQPENRDRGVGDAESLAMTASCAVAIRPPAAIKTNITYIK